MSVTTQQQYQSLQGTTVYVVDPEQLRQKVILKSFQVGKTSATEGSSVSSVKDVGKTCLERKPRKRRLESEEAVGFEDEDDSLYARTTSKEVTTRAGRVSKTKQPGSQPKVAKALDSGPRIKKREPANVFRCPSCQKVYIGYSKLKLHFRKFPDHCSYGDEGSKELHTKLRKVPESSTTETQTELRREKHVDVAVQTSAGHEGISNGTSSNHESPTAVPSQNFASFQLLLNGSQYVVPPANNHILSFCAQSASPAGSTKSSNTFSNFSSYKSDCDLSRTPASSSVVVSQTDSANEPVFNQLSPPASSNHQNCYSQQIGAKQVNTSMLLSPTILKHNNNHHNDHIQNVGFSLQRLVWDVVEEKMIQHGINEILAELSDVAERLAKIARDKIIPIREEEEEQLRANNTAPIVQVDTPFLSHLLDLPFGTYMFKEDAGVRKLLPPPVAADLSLNSLTSGVEVDIDKFLPGIDIIHLPHLTNLDFSSICSDAQ